MGRKDLLNLFNSNPPPDELLSALFCNRDREMALAVDTLVSRMVSSDILAVYGETRSGKSHFVRVMLQRLSAREAGWRIFTINANNRGAPRPVLEDVFVHLWKVLDEVRPKVGSTELKHFEQFESFQEGRRRLVTGEYAERSFETSSGTTDFGEAGVEVKAGVASARLGGRSEQRLGESEKVVARAPSDSDLVEWIRDLLAGLRQFERERPVLLFVDDLDLLHRRGLTGSEASAQLVDRLKAIAEHPHVQVLVTIRAAYFNGRDKDFHDFIQLPLLGDEVLREIYRRHITELHEGQEILSAEALELLVEGSNGQVGMFLKTCRDLFRWGYRKGVLDVPEVARFIDHQLQQLRLSPESVSFMPAIEEAMRDRRLSLKIDEDLQETPLLHSVLLPIPGQPKHYLINGIWSRAFLRSAAATKA